ncbi:TPA: fimbrial protein [Klebsiella oxytoca]
MKNIIFSILVIIFHSSYAADNLSFSDDVTLKVNIKEPICRLSSLNQHIDFGEFDKINVLNSPPEGGGVFKFTECSGVKFINLSFMGNYINASKNYLEIAEGGNYASGLAIKLYDESKNEIILSERKKIDTQNAKSYNLHLSARIIPANKNEANILPGDIKSAVTLVISYE